MSRKVFLIQVLLAACVFCTAFVTGYNKLPLHGPVGFYESQFAPALSFACTGKFWNLDLSKPAIQPAVLFLTHQTESFDCAQLPANLSAFRTESDFFQLSSLYLMGSVGMVWRVTSVSFQVLSIIGATLTAIFALSIYAVATLFVSRIIALVVVTLAMTSPLVAFMQPALRDYSKASFLVASIYICGRVIFAERTKSAVLWAALGGLVAGVGFGFRTDLAIVIPFFVFATAMFAGSHRDAFARFAMSTTVFLLVFCLLARSCDRGRIQRRWRYHGTRSA